MEQLLNEKETAEKLSVSVKTLQAWRLTNKGPAYAKMGRAVRYPVSALECFIEQSMKMVPTTLGKTEE